MIEANRRGEDPHHRLHGLDQQGEYIFRQLAQHTMGRFAFMLYGGEASHSVSDYSVEQLDDLIVRLVQEELNHLKPIAPPRSRARPCGKWALRDRIHPAQVSIWPESPQCLCTNATILAINARWQSADRVGTDAD